MFRFLMITMLMMVMKPWAFAEVKELQIIPAPERMELGEGSFVLNAGTKILFGPGATPEAEYLAEVIAPATGFELSTEELGGDETGAVVLKLDGSLERLGEEGYVLKVTQDGVEARALRPSGLFYAVQTMRQLLPTAIFAESAQTDVEWSMPSVSIEDKPRFAWRGQLFDCCRHFFDVETVKRAIDLLAMHKMNRLHWHLTEDQGWRLEIKRYPKLTEVGAWRTQEDGSRYGGFYTQEQVREIVEYAASRHITVVPEIEMPGHSIAALASYPHLGCTGGPYEVWKTWGVSQDVYCAGSDETFVLIQNVLNEVMEMFPSQYIHIGGDESPKDRWKECPKCQARIKDEGLADEHELQSYFVKRIDKYLDSHGRRMIGWDEILEGGLAPGAMVQSWRGVQGGIAAASDGHDVIMSPTSHCYIDYTYMTTPVQKSYSYEPIPEELPEDKAHHVLGLEGNMWTEFVPNRDRLDFQVYPRLTALSEVGWSPKEARDWSDFKSRLETQYMRFELLGVKYGFDEFAELMETSAVVGKWTADQMVAEGSELEWDVTDVVTKAGGYNFIFMYTSGTAAIEIKWAGLMKDGVEIGRDEHLGWSGINKRDIVYKFDVKEHKQGAKYALKAFLTPQGNTVSNGEVRVIGKDEG